MAHEQQRRARLLPPLVVLALASVAVVAATVTTIGADALWLPALGDRIRSTGRIPIGIPFAAASSADWVNTTALGQLVLSAAHSLGRLGVVITQVVVVVTTLAALATDAHARRARPLAAAAAILVVTVGGATTLFIARAQSLSLVPFALLLVLLRRQHDHPTRSIWWAVPLVALWGNLHGAALVGVAVLGAYLLLSRLRVSPVSAVGVGVASVVALCLNPGLLRAGQYYAGVLGGEATSSAAGMWSRVSPANPFDLLLVAAVLALLLAAMHQRPPLWELVAALGLLVATVLAARQGVWLLLLLLVPAATATADAGPRPDGRLTARTGTRARLVVGAVAAAGVVGAVAVLAVRAPSLASADVASADIAAATRGRVVLASEPLGESLAAAGATVWASNPLDAFSRDDQRAYLAFLTGDDDGAQDALAGADVVAAPTGSPQARLAVAAGFVARSAVGGVTLYTR